MIRDLDNLEPLDEYIQIKAQISELEERLEELKGLITYALMGEPKDTYVHKGFSFTLSRRKTWGYSEKVQELEEVLKDAKAHERDKGIARVTKEQAVLTLRQEKE